MFEELSDEELAAPITTYDAPEQFGPFRQYDTPFFCASRNCRVQTYYKVRGTPYCSVHALRKLNELLIDYGMER